MAESSNAQGAVLVVEDDRDVRYCVAMALQLEGWDVRTAPDGAAALAVLDGWQPDVILLDRAMPLMDGGAFARAYRARNPEGATLVAMTAMPDAARWAAEIGAAAVLSKPFGPARLMDVVGRFRPTRQAAPRLVVAAAI